MTISQRLNAIITERKIVKKSICEACGIAPSTLSTWFANDVTSIPSEYIMPICRFFGILPEALLCEADEFDGALTSDYGRLSGEEKLLLNNFRQLDIEGQRIVAASAITERRRSEEK